MSNTNSNSFAGKNDDRPNVLLIFFDQMQAEAINGTACHTPNIDRIANNGVRFSRAYTTSPTCSPARASFMTGALPHNHGVWWVTHTVDNDQGTLRKSLPHWAQHLRDAGYDTGYFGKWHVEHSEKPSDYGWNVDGSLHSQSFKEASERMGLKTIGTEELVDAVFVDQPEGYSRRLVGGAIEGSLRERHAGVLFSMADEYVRGRSKAMEPWCCAVATPEPHDPFICSYEKFKKYNPENSGPWPNWSDELSNVPELYKYATSAFQNLSTEERQRIATYYYAMVSELDEYVGSILSTLEETGQLEHTHVIITSDHGELLGAHGLYYKNIGGYEEAYRIPLVMQGPGIKSGEVFSSRVGLHDLGQTMLDLAGVEQLPTEDSRSFAPLLLNGTSEEDFFKEGYAESFGGRILLTQRILWQDPWKFVFNGFGKDELYNLDEDPWEMSNRIDDAETKAISKRMMERIWTLMQETGDHTLYGADYPALRVASYGPGFYGTRTDVSSW